MTTNSAFVFIPDTPKSSLQLEEKLKELKAIIKLKDE